MKKRIAISFFVLAIVGTLPTRVQAATNAIRITPNLSFSGTDTICVGRRKGNQTTDYIFDGFLLSEVEPESNTLLQIQMKSMMYSIKSSVPCPFLETYKESVKRNGTKWDHMR